MRLNTLCRFSIQNFVKPILSASVISCLLFSGLAADALEPANPKANPKARAILNYLYGLDSRQDKRLVSGQFTGFGRGTSRHLMNESAPASGLR